MKRSIFLLVLCGCASATLLEPAPEATRVPGDEDAASEESAGVSVVADPRPSEDGYTPIDLIIRNDSPYPLRLKYESFELQTRDGYVFSAIPIERVGYYRYTPYYWGPFYYDYWGYWGPYWYGGWYHPWHYSGWYWTYVGPSTDILRRAISEGVLKPGESMRGYVFFPEIDEDETPVAFRMRFIDADSGEVFGSLLIPFIAKS